MTPGARFRTVCRFGRVAYTTGNRGLSKTACTKLGPRGIRFHAIHAGFIETEMSASATPAFGEANVRETSLDSVVTTPSHKV